MFHHVKKLGREQRKKWKLKCAVHSKILNTSISTEGRITFMHVKIYKNRQIKQYSFTEKINNEENSTISFSFSF